MHVDTLVVVLGMYEVRAAVPRAIVAAPLVRSMLSRVGMCLSLSTVCSEDRARRRYSTRSRIYNECAEIVPSMKNNNMDCRKKDRAAAPHAAIDADTNPGRRAFLRALAASAAALAVTACGGAATTNGGSNPPANPGSPPPPAPPPPGNPPPPGGANQAPVWQVISTIAFTQGVAATFSIAGSVSDADGDALTIVKNSAALPPGVTYDAANKRFVYDGVGAVGSTGGHVLTADDGNN